MNARLFVLPALAVAAAVVWWSSNRSTGPACTWRIGTGTEIRQGRNFEELAPETPFRLSFHSSEPLHVYMFSHNTEDGTVLLWPSSALATDLQRPLPSGHSVLPGAREGNEVAWTTRSGIRASTTYLVVAAREPIGELDQLLPSLRHWSNTVFPDHTMLVTNPPAGTQVIRGAALPHPLLEAASKATVTELLPNGPLTPAPDREGVWYGSWKIVEQKKT